MPYDSPKATTHNNNKPLLPTLASRVQARSPLTPRLAAQHQNASNAVGGIVPKRLSARNDSNAAKLLTSGRDEGSAPAKAFVNHNVTPRSSSRKSRVDSAQSTPAGSTGGTPIISQGFTASGEIQQISYGAGNTTQQSLDTTAAGLLAIGSRPRSTVAGVASIQGASMSKTATVRSGTTSPVKDDVSMFFHADQARNVMPSASSRPPLRKDLSFFYANGDTTEENIRSNSRSPPPIPAPLPIVAGARSTQFFHADDRFEEAHPQQGVSPLHSPPLHASLQDVLQGSNPVNHTSILRPTSPTKDSIHLTYRKGASQVMRPISMLPPRDSPDIRLTRRRSSAEPSSLVLGHKKTASLSSIASASIDSGSRRGSNVNHSIIQPEKTTLDLGSTTQKVPPSLPSPLLATPLSVDVHGILSSPELSTPLSPTKAAANTAHQLSELAANARRDRKVMDLEISNSSLLAINKQLEKQLRSQKAELRRFRRLTRAGRLSIATNEADEVIGTTDDQETYLESEDEGIQNSSSSLSDEASDESDEFSPLSPSAQAEKDEKRIAKDEERLRLDLSKHRQLLVDSQKMNQSLRRCLGWTEELINEGKKALSYRVRVSDVKLGGRVLTRDEDHEENLAEEHPEEDFDVKDDEDDQFDSSGLETEAAQTVNDVMGMMSPWMRMGKPKSDTVDNTFGQTPISIEVTDSSIREAQMTL